MNIGKNVYLCTQIDNDMVIEYEKDYLEELYIITICTVTDITNHYQ